MSSRRRLATAAIVLFTGVAVAQVPTTVAKITNLDVSQGSPQLEYQNTGAKALTAIAIVQLKGAHKGQLLIAEYPSAPLAPGEARSIPAPEGLDAGKLDSQLAIGAVIFADGTHLGSAPDPAYNNVDVVDELFEQRRGEADELARWAKKVAALPPDDRAALEQFVKVASALNPSHVQRTQYDIGVAGVQGGMRATADRVEKALTNGGDAKSVRAQYLSRIPDRAAVTAKLATHAAQ